MKTSDVSANMLRSYAVQHDRDEIVKLAKFVHQHHIGDQWKERSHAQATKAATVVHRKLYYALGNWGSWEGEFWLVCLDDESCHFGPLHYLLDTIKTWSAAWYSLTEPTSRAPKNRK